MATKPRLLWLGFGKFARSDRIYALEPLLGEERGDGHRTKVWVEGIEDPIIAARTDGEWLIERTPRDGSVKPGDFLVASGDVAAVAEQTGVDFVALKAPVTTGAYALRKPRVAMLQRYGGGNMDEGWTRLMFEQFSVPFKSIMDAELKAGGLEAKYDTIILPADSIAAMTGERPPAGAGGGGGFGGGPDNTPPDFKSGFGAEGVKALQAFVEKGGTLVTFANAGDLAIQRFGLPLRNVVAGLPSNHSPLYAPVVDPTLEIGVRALVSAVHTWLPATTGH